MAGQSTIVPSRIDCTSAMAAGLSRVSGGSSTPRFQCRFGIGLSSQGSIARSSMPIAPRSVSIVKSVVDTRFLVGSPAHRASAHKMSVGGG
eukprot:7268005-Prymnesium_polylepis.1